MFTKKEWQLHGAFFMTTLGDRMWTFVIGLFMHTLGGMTWVAVQQLVDSVLKLGFITVLGQFLDRINRSKIIQYSLLINNAAVAISAGLFAYLFATKSDHSATFILLAAAGFASISKVASEIQRICFTKDWVVVISKSENVELSRVNSFLMGIDQISSTFLPMFSGYLLDKWRWEIVCIFIIAYNFASWTIESMILRTLYKTTPQLQCRESEIKGDEELRGLLDIRCSSFGIYFNQTSWTAGFGLSLLYMTVLGFDNIAVSYGQKHGLSPQFLGLLRTFGSLMGVAGAFCFHPIAKRIGLLWTVILGLVWQNIFINFCGISMFLPGSSMDLGGFVKNTTVGEWLKEALTKIAHPESESETFLNFYEAPFPILFFFMGIMLARFGLWIADPAITQIQQETIPEKQRYMVFTVQLALCEAFSILKDIIVIMFPFTSLFGVLTLGSCAFVFTGFMFNVYYHAKCGFSCHNKNMHIGKRAGCEMTTLSNPERQSLMGEEVKNPVLIIE